MTFIQIGTGAIIEVMISSVVAYFVDTDVRSDTSATAADHDYIVLITRS